MGKCTISKSRVPWNLSGEDIKTIYPLLLNKFETSGMLTFKPSEGGKTMVTEAIKATDIKKGNKDSVYTPLGVSVFHVHPYSCYHDADVVWGWPSGEDISQTIAWSLKGNLLHTVFSVEGIYTIEVNPCFAKYLGKIGNDQDADFKRGIIIKWVEEIGKSTHELRDVDICEKHRIIPQDWIELVNNLKINCSVNNGEAVINCKSCPHKEVITDTIRNYLNYTDNHMAIPTYNVNGSVTEMVTIQKSEFLEKVKDICNTVHDFKCGETQTRGGKWKKNSIFYVDLHWHKESQCKFTNCCSESSKPYCDYYDNWIKQSPRIQPPSKIIKLSNNLALNKHCKKTPVALKSILKHNLLINNE
uniref:Uncharacterized protein n=1 Tax=viral metagenome TaxID=1070528 RepID=A0A6C0KE15_9ZZZZ